MKSIFISYAWDETTRVSKYAHEIDQALNNHNMTVYFDKRCNNSIGSDIDNFINKISTVDHIVLLLSRAYLKKIHDSRSRVYVEWSLIKERLSTQQAILPVLYDIDASEKPDELYDLVHYSMNENMIDHLLQVIIGNSSQGHLKNRMLQINETLKIHELKVLTNEIINELYPEYDWIRVESNELYKIYDQNIVQIIDIENNNNHLLELETICLEGYIEKSLKGIFVFTNFNLNERFMCMAHMHYQKSGKNIHFFDRQLLINYNNKHRLNLPSPVRQVPFTTLTVIKDYILSEESINNYKSSFINQSELILNNLNSDFSYISNLALNEIYFIHLKIVTECARVLTIKLCETQYLINVNDINTFQIVKGLNYISFPIQTAAEILQFQPELEIYFDDKILIHKMNYITISKLMKEKIQFDNQYRVEKSFGDLINENLHTDNNLFLNLYAAGGSGKTHILQSLVKNIHQDLSGHIEVLHLTFTNSHKKNRDLLSNLLFYIVTFMPFEYGSDFLMTSKKFHYYMGSDLLNILKKLKNEDDFSHFTSEFISVLEKDHSQNLPYYINNKKHMIILDDLQKLGTDASSMLTIIIQYIRKTQKRFIVLTSSRKNELKASLKQILKFSETFELEPLSHRDIMSSIEIRRPEWGSYIQHSALDSNLNDFLVFYAIEFLNKLCQVTIDSLMQFNERIKIVSHTIKTPDYVQNKFVDLIFDETRLLNLVYILSKTGIDYEWVDEQEYKILCDLVSKGLLKKVNGKFEKAHDLLVESFPLDYDDSVAHILLEHYQTYKNIEVLGELIKCRFNDRLKYIHEAINILNEHFKNTNYKMSLLLSESIEYAMSDDECYRMFDDISKLTIKFKRAYCLNFCGSVIESKNKFFAISTMRKIDDIDYMGIVLEGATEKLNLDYWHIDNTDLINDILDVRYKIESYDYSRNEHLIRAYLNTYNREMVTRLLHDEYDIAQELLPQNIDISKEYARDDYVGFAHMDYAKGCYNIDIQMALKHLLTAEKIFKNSDNSRRLIDCQCEIEFLQLILDENREIRHLEQISKILFERNLIQLYVKSLVKIIAVKIYRNERALRLLDDILGKITLLSPDSIDNRLTLIIANLDYIKSIKLGTSLYIKDIEERLERFTFGQSYRAIIDLNKNMKKDAPISWASNQKEHSFVIDLRLW